MLEELYLVRHAAPDRNQKIAYNTLPGPPLTLVGEQEAVQAARWLVCRAVDHVLASPFTRTRMTADAIVAGCDLPLTIVDALREGGPGETMAQIQERAAELLAQTDDSPLRSVALVTHGAVIRALLQHTTGSRIDLRSHVYDYGNCAPTAGIWHGVRSEGGWRWELIFRPPPS